MSTGVKPTKTVDLVLDNFGFFNARNGDHVPVKRFTWKNHHRIQIQLITYGATITSIKYPNKKGIIDDVLLGFDDMKGYVENQIYTFGSTIGRYASYVRNSCFTINKKEYNLSPNMGRHHYNGGFKGFDRVVWNHHVNGNKVILSYLSPDTEEGYPGDLIIFASFELGLNNEFRIEFKAMSTKPTIVNIANRCYFNLAGHSCTDEIDKHVLMINADCHTITDETMLPTGEIRSVLNTIYDFQVPVEVGTVLEKLDGFNENFCINKGTEQGLTFVGRLSHPPSGRILEVYSNQSGVEFDTANTLPLRTELEVPIVRPSKNPYIKSGVATFDLLDEIYNRVVDIMEVDKLTDYSDLIALIEDFQKKGRSVHKNSANGIETTSGLVKRSSITLDMLHTFPLTSLQKKYIERIVEVIDKFEEPNYLINLKGILVNALTICKTSNETLPSTPSSDSKRSSKLEPMPTKQVRGKKGARYCKHAGLCLQTQNYPDAANNPNFPTCLLKPGNVYNHIIVYKFWVKTDQSGISGII